MGDHTLFLPLKFDPHKKGVNRDIEMLHFYPQYWGNNVHFFVC